MKSCHVLAGVMFGRMFGKIQVSYKRSSAVSLGVQQPGAEAVQQRLCGVGCRLAQCQVALIGRQQRRVAGGILGRRRRQRAALLVRYRKHRLRRLGRRRFLRLTSAAAALHAWRVQLLAATSWLL